MQFNSNRSKRRSFHRRLTELPIADYLLSSIALAVIGLAVWEGRNVEPQRVSWSRTVSICGFKLISGQAELTEAIEMRPLETRAVVTPQVTQTEHAQAVVIRRPSAAMVTTTFRTRLNGDVPLLEHHACSTAAIRQDPIVSTVVVVVDVETIWVMTRNLTRHCVLVEELRQMPQWQGLC